MGILANLVANFAGRATDDGRAYERFRTELDSLMHVETEAGEVLPIADVSFGGIAVREAADAMPGAKQTLALQVLDQRVLLAVELVRAHDGVNAYRFAAHGLESLVALHTLLRGLETGGKMQLKGPATVGADGGRKFILSERKRTRLRVTTTAAGELRQLLLASDSDSRPWEFAVAHGRITVARAATGTPAAAGIRTGVIEKLVIRQATYVLAAIKYAEVQPLLEGVVGLCLRELGIKV